MAENNSFAPLMTDKELLMEGSAYSEILAAAFEYADSYCSSGDEPRRYAVAIDHLRKTVRAEITKFSRANYKTNAATEFDAQAVAAQAPAAVVVPDGWKLVPLKPTDEMQKACKSVVDLEQGDPEDHHYDDGITTVNEIYSAMLSAAPPQPEREPLKGDTND